MEGAVVPDLLLYLLFLHFFVPLLASFGFWVLDCGFQVSGSRVRVSGLRLWVSEFGLEVLGFSSRV